MYVDNCQTCTKTKPCQNSCIRQPLQRTYDPCDGPEDIMRINLVGELPNSNGYGYVLMACDVLFLWIGVRADTPQWDRYIILAVMAHNTTYHQSIECTPNEISHRRVPHNALDLKFRNPLQTLCTKTDWQTLVDEVNRKY